MQRSNNVSVCVPINYPSSYRHSFFVQHLPNSHHYVKKESLVYLSEEEKVAFHFVDFGKIQSCQVQTKSLRKEKRDILRN